VALVPAFLGICSGFLTIVLFCGGWEGPAESPKAYVWRDIHFCILDPLPNTSPDPAQVQMFTGSLLLTLPLAARRPQRKKAQEA
jgi:hypothetical protein